MDEMRWILLLIGVLMIGGIYLYTRLQSQGRARRAGNRERKGRGEPVHDTDIEGALEELDALIADDLPEHREPSLTTAFREPSPREVESRAEPPRPHESRVEETPPAGDSPETPIEALDLDVDTDEASGIDEKIVVINVVAPPGREFGGEPVRRALEAAGLEHGDMRIFHRQVRTGKGLVRLFSVANIVEPGWFDLERIEEQDTPGLAFFLRLPAPFDGMAAFEQMIEAARQVAGDLGGRLLDARRCDLTGQAVEHIREELREYRRVAHLRARRAR